MWQRTKNVMNSSVSTKKNICRAIKKRTLTQGEQKLLISIARYYFDYCYYFSH